LYYDIVLRPIGKAFNMLKLADYLEEERQVWFIPLVDKNVWMAGKTV